MEHGEKERGIKKGSQPYALIILYSKLSVEIEFKKTPTVTESEKKAKNMERVFNMLNYARSFPHSCGSGAVHLTIIMWVDGPVKFTYYKNFELRLGYDVKHVHQPDSQRWRIGPCIDFDGPEKFGYASRSTSSPDESRECFTTLATGIKNDTRGMLDQ